MSDLATLEREAPATDAALPRRAPAPEAKEETADKPEQGIDDRSEEARAEAELNDDLRKVYRNANKPAQERGEDGKFSAKDQKPAPATNAEPETDAKTEPTEAEPKEAVKGGEPAKEPAKAKHTVPDRWKKIEAKWSALPEDVQKDLSDLALADRQEISRLGKDAANFNNVRQMLDGHRGYLEQVQKATGKAPLQFLNEVVAGARQLDADPEGALADLANAYGVKPERLMQRLGVQAGQPDEFAQLFNDPRVDSLESEVRRLTGLLEQQQQHQESARRAERQQRQTEMEQMIDAFAADKTDFAELAPAIFANVSVLRHQNPSLAPADVLEQAYDAARWSHPATRAKLVEEQKAAAEKERTERAKKEAEAARKAASINVTSRTNGAVSGNLDDDLRSIWRRMNA